LVLLSSYNQNTKSTASHQEVEHNSPICRHSVVDRYQLKATDFEACKLIACKNGKSVIPNPNGRRGTFCTKCNTYFCSYNCSCDYVWGG
jgi:hypothetical protein